MKLKMYVLIHKIQQFLKNEDGVETLEYVAIGSIVLVAAAAGYTPGISTVISTGLSNVTSAMG